MEFFEVARCDWAVVQLDPFRTPFQGLFWGPARDSVGAPSGEIFSVADSAGALARRANSV
eukprot:5077605-Pyramimonas_sp.AAC.1